MQKTFTRYDEVSLALAERQTVLSDTTHALDSKHIADLQEQCLALKDQQQKLIAADSQLSTLVRDIAHLETLQIPQKKTWLNKLDDYNEAIGNITFETVQDANLASTFSQLASQFIYPLPIVGAAVLSCVELVDLLKAAAFEKETHNRRAVKIGSGLAIFGLTVAAAVLILNPIGLTLTAAACTVKAGRDRFLAYKADKDCKRTMVELEQQQHALAAAEKQAYDTTPTLKTAVDAIKHLHLEQQRLSQQLQTQDPKSDSYATAQQQLTHTQHELAERIVERNNIIQQQHPDIVRLALKTHRLATDAKALAKVHREKLFDARVGYTVIVGTALTIFGGPAAIVGACILTAAATTSIIGKSPRFQASLSKMWHVVTGKTPQPSPTPEDHLDYVQKNTLHLGEVRTFDLHAKNNHLANHYHATPALREAVKNLNQDLNRNMHASQAAPLPPQDKPIANRSSSVVDKLRQQAHLPETPKTSITPSNAPTPTHH